VTRPNCLLHIGREVPNDDGPALLIFEARNLPIYYVCTPYNGVLGGQPSKLGLTSRGRAIDFDEVVEGNERDVRSRLHPAPPTRHARESGNPASPRGAP
jgi:hypothetical protein